MENNELQEAAVNILSGLVNIAKSTRSKFNDKTVDIYKGRHDNPIYKKVKDAENAVIDKIKPLDRFHLIDKLQKPASQDNSHSDRSNYQVEVNGEIVFQESTDGKVNVNRVGQFISKLLSPELESEQAVEQEEFTVADAFSSEYDPPKEELQGDYNTQSLDEFLKEPESYEQTEPELEYDPELVSPKEPIISKEYLNDEARLFIEPPQNDQVQLEVEQDTSAVNTLSPELESEQAVEQKEFTVADAFSAEYDPPGKELQGDYDIQLFDEYLEQQPEQYEQTKSELAQEPELVSPKEPRLSKEYLNDEARLFIEPPQNDQVQLEVEQDTSAVNNSPQNKRSEPSEKKLDSIYKNLDAIYKNLDAIYTVAQNDVKSIKSPGVVKRLQSILKSTFSQLRDGIDKLNKTASHHVNAAQQKTAAKTFKKLFDANIIQTGETTFKSNSFDVKLKGNNTYEVTDKQGNLKLSFNDERFKGIKINQSSLSGKDFKSIQRATQSVNALGADKVLKQDLAGRVSFLGSIAPKSDHQIRDDLDTNAVAKTAQSFLHYMGVSSWNREGGAYQIEKSGENLKITANESGQEILRINKGKLSSRLKPKDINFFRELDSSMKVEVNKIRNKEKNYNVTSELRSTSTPKKFTQQEISR